MKKCLLIFCYSFVFFSCNKEETSNVNKYVAIINNQPILGTKVDSLISDQIYQLRKNALKGLLRSEIIEFHAKCQKMGKEEFVKKSIHLNNTINPDQYYEYIGEHGINSKNNDSIKIIEYLLALNKQKQFEHFADSLLTESNLTINLMPTRYDKVIVDNFDFHELSGGKKIVAYILSDYNCPACQNTNKKLKKIIEKYKSNVSFRFAYISEYIDKKAIVAEAAANQGKFIQMHDFLFDHPEIKGEDPSILKFAKELGVNMEEFEKDMMNPETLKKLIINKQKIIAQNIYVTPSFIIDNKVINDEFSLNTFENLINEDIRTKE